MCKKKLLLVLLVLIVIQSGCVGKLVEKRPVLTVNLVLTGTYDNPVIDEYSTIATAINMPLLKQQQYDDCDLPSIYSRAFYRQNAISNTRTTPYHGAGNYSLTITFNDKPIPSSPDEHITLLVGIIDSDGTNLLKQYIYLRWPEVK